MSRRDELAANLAVVRDRVAEAEKKAGRAPGSVSLLPVTKFHPASDLGHLAQLGCREVAENREQEARAKAEEFPEASIHMIGQIQSKKANSVARWAAAVHSLDSVALADKLDRGMALALERGDRDDRRDVLPCYIQLSADGDTQRGGVAQIDLDAVVASVVEAEHLLLAGLMVVPPLGYEPGKVFTWARELVEHYGQQLHRRLDLSAGMSSDLDEAIAAGSDLVRVGTAIMGPRPIA